LLVVALRVETQGLLEAAGARLFTGAGKVNATYALMRELAEFHARGESPLVVNLGTAGSRTYPAGSLVASRRFAQRDMDVTGLGFPLGVTPFEEQVPAELEFPELFGHLPHGVCGTGDRFEAHSSKLAWDLIDMEAYALAKVCFLERVPFACAKYVSDGADGAAATDWQTSLNAAAREFVALYEWLKERGANATLMGLTR
jgi:adenosylhomocysteine nucleosidase